MREFKTYNVSGTISNLFMDLFILKVNGLAIKGEDDGSCTDEIYGIAHEKFQEIAEIIETILPDIVEEDTDDVKWYDEYHDDCVSDFCNYLMR